MENTTGRLEDVADVLQGVMVKMRFAAGCKGPRSASVGCIKIGPDTRFGQVTAGRLPPTLLGVGGESGAAAGPLVRGGFVAGIGGASLGMRFAVPCTGTNRVCGEAQALCFAK
jgi:hypothetical protein